MMSLSSTKFQHNLKNYYIIWPGSEILRCTARPDGDLNWFKLKITFTRFSWLFDVSFYYTYPANSIIPVQKRRGGSRRRVQGVRTPPPPPRDDLRFSNTTGILPKKKNTIWFIGVEVEQETSAPPPKKNPGSAPGTYVVACAICGITPGQKSWYSCFISYQTAPWITASVVSIWPPPVNECRFASLAYFFPIEHIKVAWYTLN